MAIHDVSKKGADRLDPMPSSPDRILQYKPLGTTSIAPITDATTSTSQISMGNSVISLGQSAYNSGTGFWLGLDTDDVAKFSIGSPTGNYFTFDGANLAINGSITAASIASGLITGTMIASRTITASNITAGTITGTEIDAATITSTNIAAGTITASNIAAGTITTNEIAAGTITGTNISALDLTGKTLTADTGTIGGFTIGTSELVGPTGAVLRSHDMTDFGVGSGFWIGNASGTGKFYFGAAGGDAVYFDGTNLHVTAAINVSKVLNSITYTSSGLPTPPTSTSVLSPAGNA